MIAKAKVISHGANAIRYSVDKDKAEIVKTNLLPDDISPMAMWARMLALQKKFEDKLNRYHPLKRNMIRIEVSPTSEEAQGWTIEDWQRLADDFIREFDAVDLSAKSKRKSAKATNLKDSQYVVALHRDSKSGIMHLHIDANRIDMRGNVNDAHYIYERAMAAAAKVGLWRTGRGWLMTLSVSLMRLTFQPSRSARVQRQPTSKTANMLLHSIVTARVALCTFTLMRTA